MDVRVGCRFPASQLANVASSAPSARAALFTDSPLRRRDVFNGYDLRGLQLSARFDSQSGEGVTNAYDGSGRMVSSSINISGTTRTLTYLHDRNGNRTRITHPDGLWFDLAHDGLNRPFYLSRTSSFGLMFTSYLPNGLPSASSRGNDSLSPYDYGGS